MAGERGTAHLVIDLQARTDLARVEQKILSHEQVCEVRWSNVIQRLQDMRTEQGSVAGKLDELRRAGTRQLYALLGGSLTISGLLLWTFVINKGG